MNIVELIPRGKQNAISSTRLVNRSGLSDRDLREAIFQARKSGAAICSSVHGYYMPNSVDEALEYFYAQRKRVITGNIALNSVRRYIDEEGNREQLERLERFEREGTL
ncbi:MAG: hypothetical protein ACI4KR_02430 [Ruminiclostridium sp.]